MFNFRNLKIVSNNPGVMNVVVDMPGRAVNVLDQSLLEDLATLVSHLEQSPQVRLVVFRSGKESGFLAGADVKQLQEISTVEQADVVLKAGQELFSRIAALKATTVAVIHGSCLGGGLEFAMSCTHRVARDDAGTRLGLPETQLGILPGWGGTQRLPRLVGAETALRMILEGQRLSAAKAYSRGLVDMIAPPEQFEAALDKFLTDRLAGKSVRRKKSKWLAWLRDETTAGRWVLFQLARRQLGGKAKQYPALPAVLRAVETGLRSGLDEGLAVERSEFGKVLFSSTCRRLLDLFFQRERARKPATWVSGTENNPHTVKTVAVLGAGTMGAGIAQLAAFQGYHVVLKDIQQDLVDAGIKRINELFDDAVKAGALGAAEADHGRHAVEGTVNWDAVAAADVVIEAVVERMEVKQDVFRELDRRLPPTSLMVSNTSALPIHEMASVTQRPDQVAGLHFFNPVHKMQLVEVVKTESSSEQTIATLVELVRNLGKVPIVVAEGPGFLVNRILFPYLDEAVRLVSEGATAEEVDREAKRFGMPMGPLELLDQVGIDIARDVSHSLSALSGEPSPTPEWLAAMTAKGQLGKKSGAGFYKYSSKGDKEGVAPAVQVTHGKPALPPPVWFGDGEMVGGIAQRLMLSLVNTAAVCLSERVVTEAWMVDLGMVLGTGFAPFRGGPLRLADSWGLQHVVATLDRLATTCGPRFNACALLRDMHQRGVTFYHDTHVERDVEVMEVNAM